jgi:hypothetical protein
MTLFRAPWQRKELVLYQSRFLMKVIWPLFEFQGGNQWRAGKDSLVFND